MHTYTQTWNGGRWRGFCPHHSPTLCQSPYMHCIFQPHFTIESMRPRESKTCVLVTALPPVKTLRYSLIVTLVSCILFLGLLLTAFYDIKWDFPHLNLQAAIRLAEASDATFHNHLVTYNHSDYGFVLYYKTLLSNSGNCVFLEFTSPRIWLRFVSNDDGDIILFLSSTSKYYCFPFCNYNINIS